MSWRFVNAKHKEISRGDEDGVEVITDESEREASGDEGKENNNEDEAVREFVSSVPDRDAMESSSSVEEEVLEDQVADETISYNETDPLIVQNEQLDDDIDDSLRFQRSQHIDDVTPISEVIVTVFRYGALTCAVLAILCSLLVTSFLFMHNSWSGSVVKNEHRISSINSHELEEALSRLQSAFQLNDRDSWESTQRLPSQRVLDNLIAAVRQIESKISERIDHLVKLNGERAPTADHEGPHEEVSANLQKERLTIAPEVVQTEPEILPALLEDNRNTVSDGSKEAHSDSVGDQNDDAVSDRFVEQKEVEDLENVVKLHPHAEHMDDGSKETNPQPSAHLQKVLQTLKTDVLLTQKLIYSKIMSSLFEYKTNAYKNLLQSGLDSYLSSDMNSDQKSTNQNVELLQKMQNLISDSSASHFNWWYAFYFNEVYPKFSDILQKVDILSSFEGAWLESGNLSSTIPDSGVSGNEADSDSFFIRATLPRIDANYEEEPRGEGKSGFDWANLHNKLREISRNLEPKTFEEDNSQTKDALGSESVDVDEAANLKIARDVQNSFTDWDSEGVVTSGDDFNDDGIVSEDHEHDDKINDSTPPISDYESPTKSKPDSSWKERRDFYSGYPKMEHYVDNTRRHHHTHRSKGRHFDSKSNFKNIVNKWKNKAKKAGTELLKLMKKGINSYEHLISSWRPKKDDAQKQQVWRSVFVKELQDVLSLVPKSPLVTSLNEFQFKAMKFLGDNIGKIINDVESHASEEPTECSSHCSEPDSNSESDSSSDDDSNAIRRVKGNHKIKKSDDPHNSWFLELGHHRSKARGDEEYHPNKRDSWFFSSSKHRAEMRRQRHSSTLPFASYPASTKR